MILSYQFRYLQQLSLFCEFVEKTNHLKVGFYIKDVNVKEFLEVKIVINEYIIR